MICAGQVARMGEKTDSYGILMGNEGIKENTRKSKTVWTEFIWPSSGLL
jgi:hypothetical protein